MAPTPASTGPRLTPRIALLVALAVILVAGATVACVEWQLRAGRRAGSGELDPAARAVAAFAGQRLESLELAAAELAARPEVAAAAAGGAREPGRGERGAAGPGRPPAAAPEAEAGPSPLVQALEDELDRRQLELVVVRDPEGRVVASAGGPEPAAGAFATSPAVVRAGVDGATRGALLLGDALYLVAARRAGEAAAQAGVVAVADLVNQSLALQAQSLARADLAFVALGEGGTGKLAASSLGRDDADGLVPALAASGALSEAVQRGSRVGPVEIVLAGRRFEAAVEPLADPAGRPVAALVTLAEHGGASPALRWVEWVALGAGLLALVVGLVGAPLIGRAATGPVREVAEAATAARGGDLVAASRHEVPGPLADFFRDLVEKRALENLVAARPAGADDGPAGAAERLSLAVLVVEMPRYGRTRGSDEPREVAERLARDLLAVRGAVAARGGRVEAALGHRVLAGFPGEGAAARALAAGAEVLRRLSEPANAFDEPVPPTVALAAGPVILAGRAGARTLAGLPVQQAESLLREASSGDLILSKGIAAELRERLAAAGVELTAQRGLLTPQLVYLLDAERAARAAAALGLAEHSAGGAEHAAGGAELAILAPGAVIADRFTLEERIEGGDDRVLFRARDRETGAPVALEALARSLLADPDALEELGNPIRAVLHVAHPALARVVELGIDGRVPFVAAEWAAGPRLDRTLAREGALPPAAALRVARYLAAGLAAVHGARLAHGAVRPAAVALDPRGHARLTGLGVAALLPPPGTDPDADRLLGPARYLAPERLAGEAPSAAADVFAAGAVLVEIFTGRPIPESGSPELPDPTTLPEGLPAVLARCLARDPGERYADGAALGAALAEIRA